MSEGDSMGAKPKMGRAKIWFLELRAPFFTAAILPVLIGAAFVFWEKSIFNLALVLITLAGTVSLHAGTNMINDYFDYRSDDDPRNQARTPFNGGSPFIVNGMLKPKSVLIAALLAFAVGGLIGLYLAWTVTWWILPVGIAGGLLGLLYVEPKINLAARGIGEIALGLGFGPLMVFGTYLVLTGEVSWLSFLAGIPIGFLITLVLYINQFPDMEADASVGKNHWVVRIGRKRASVGYPIIFGITYAFVILAILFGILPVLSLLFLATIPIAFKASRIVLKNPDNVRALIPAQALTIQIHLLGGLLLTVGIAISPMLL
ncbi:MAG TPA: prenyltransferase [Thermoplasmata archaeon]|nr:prenyltransferase [Thermoplasmata archaeon]